jgi:hypothetical protein
MQISHCCAAGCRTKSVWEFQVLATDSQCSTKFGDMRGYIKMPTQSKPFQIRDCFAPKRLTNVLWILKLQGNHQFIPHRLLRNKWNPKIHSVGEMQLWGGIRNRRQGVLQRLTSAFLGPQAGTRSAPKIRNLSFTRNKRTKSGICVLGTKWFWATFCGCSNCDGS